MIANVPKIPTITNSVRRTARAPKPKKIFSPANAPRVVSPLPRVVSPPPRFVSPPPLVDSPRASPINVSAIIRLHENADFTRNKFTCADSPLPRASSPLCEKISAMLLASDACEVGYQSNGERFSDREVNPPELTMHRSVYEPATTPTYSINVGGKNKSGNQLTDAMGYTYSFNKASKCSASWHCTSRPSKNPRRAAVLQKIISENFSVL